MFKKIEIWILYILILLFLIFVISYGSLLRHYMLGGSKFSNLSNIILFSSEIPSNLKKIIFPNYDLVSIKHKAKKEVNFKLPLKKNYLLLLSRYSAKEKKFVVEIKELDNFETLHSYEIYDDEVKKKINKKKEFKTFLNRASNKSILKSPVLLDDGSIIFQQEYGPLVKKDFCGKISWVNTHDQFHHYIYLTQNNEIYVPTSLYPYSNLVAKHRKDMNFKDDAISLLNSDGKIIYQKSVIEILKDNNLYSETLFKNDDPIHLNKIEPVLKSSNFFLKGDLFLSSPATSSIIHYRPSNNKVINYIVGDFSWQHDVDVISDKEISIFNNNEYGIDNKHSEIIIYNFETKKFTKKFEKTLRKLNFKTKLQGSHQLLSDGSLFLEETLHGRIILLDKNANLNLEYVNKFKDKSYMLAWSSIIENEEKIEKILELIKSKKCKN